MFKKLINNKKGAAEVVGSVMFIVILMFFFTNVYLWHDAAVKEMNDLYAEKLNSQIRIINDEGTLKITNAGGVAATIECYWIIEHSSPGQPDTNHQRFPVSGLVIRPGEDWTITWSIPQHCTLKVITTTGNIATINL